MINIDKQNEITEKNRTYGIDTKFIYAEETILGYSYRNTIYCLNKSNFDIDKLNNHELFHFFENTEIFKKIKDYLIVQLSKKNIYEEVLVDYELRYYGLYTDKEISQGILDTEIVIDILSGNSEYSNLITPSIQNEILKNERIELDNKRYLTFSLRQNIRNLKGLSKWEKIFAENFYSSVNYDRKKYNMPSGKDKVYLIKSQIDLELEKLYNLDSGFFEIDPESKSIKRYFEYYEEELQRQGRVLNYNELQTYKKRFANKISKQLYNEYCYIVEIIKKIPYESAFKTLMLRETLLKTYKKDNSKSLVNKRIKGETIISNMLLNKEILDIIYDNLEDYNSFENLYFAAISIFEKKITDTLTIDIDGVNTYGKGKWIKFDGKKDNTNEYLENAQNLSAIIQNTTWCTKTCAALHLEQGDFYVFVDNNRVPHVAVKMNGREIGEVRGIENGESQELENEYRDVALSFLKNNKELEGALEWLEKEEWNERLMYDYKNLRDGKLTKEEIPNFLLDLNGSKQKIAHGYNFNLERLKEELETNFDKYKPLFAEYFGCNENEICYNYTHDSSKDTCEYKIILNNADFKDSNITSLNGLKYVVGNVNFRNSQIEDLGDLEYVSGNCDFTNTKLSNTGCIKFIGGDAIFTNSNITSLKTLEKIMGSAYFNDSNVSNLGNLKEIGDNVYFENSKVQNLVNLERIGKDAYFENSDVNDLSNLKIIGGSVYFKNSKITTLQNLEYVGNNLELENSIVNDMGNLQFIGGNANLKNTFIKTLNNITSIEGSLDIRNSEVTDLGKLEKVGKNANCSNSKLLSIGLLTFVGGNIYLRNSGIFSLGNLRQLNGNLSIAGSNVCDLGDLQYLGGTCNTDNLELQENIKMIKENSKNIIKK